MNKRQKKRLLNVAKACREMKEPSEFNMGLYGRQCGTPACAMGNYAFRRDLQRTFKLVQGSIIMSTGLYILVTFRHEIAPHFGITYDETCELFESDGCDLAATHIEAAKYIERFVAERA